MKFTRIPNDTFKKLQLNAGVFARNFDPATGEIGNLFGATTGGLTFNTSPTFVDFGDDIDNCPKNTKELKQLDSNDITLAGTLLTIDPATAKDLMAAADIDANDATHIIPRRDLAMSDFHDVWWVGDYSDENTGASAGYVAIHLMDALNTGGFQLKTTDKGKGNFAFTYTAHASMETPDVVPYEVFIKSGAGSTPYIVLNKHTLTIAVDEEVTLGYEVNPSDATVSFASSASGKASVGASTGVVKGLEAGSTIITASITEDGVTYTDTCTVVVEASQG